MAGRRRRAAPPVDPAAHQPPPTRPPPTRARPTQAPIREPARVTVRPVGGRALLDAVDAAAAGQGLRPGMAVTDARALVPDLAVTAADPAADRRTLQRLADWCDRYTPWVAIDEEPAAGTAGLVLDVTGCGHLQGGEAALLRDLLERLRAGGWTVAGGLAGSAAMAWAAARFVDGAAGRGAVIPPDGDGDAAADLPVGALRLDGDTVAGLCRVGLRCVGDLAALPRATLSLRFGRHVHDRLAQLLGVLEAPLSPRRPAPSYRARLGFVEPVGSTQAVAAGLDRLLADLLPALERDGQGVRSLELTLFPADGRADAGRDPSGGVQRVTVGTSRASRDAAHLKRLFDERLNGLTAQPDIDALALAAIRVEPLRARQPDLAMVHRRPADSRRDAERRQEATATGRMPEGRSAGARRSAGHAPGRPAAYGTTPGGAARAGTMGVSELVDRLSARLGAGAVRRPVHRASHVPERATAWMPVAVGAAERGGAALALRQEPGPVRAVPGLAVPGEAGQAPADPALSDPALSDPALSDPVLADAPWGGRPLRLFRRPEPVTAVAVLPDHPPVMIRWRDRLLRIRCADGPERLLPEWWRTPVTARPEPVQPVLFPGLDRLGPAGETAARRAGTAGDGTADGAVNGAADDPRDLLTDLAAGDVAAVRDYYRVEDFDGGRYWLYREGGPGPAARWFLQGVFA